MNVKQILIWTGRTALLLLLFFILFIIGSMAVSGMLPDIESEPGLVPGNIGFLIFGILNTLLIIEPERPLLADSSRSANQRKYRPGLLKFFLFANLIYILGGSN